MFNPKVTSKMIIVLILVQMIALHKDFLLWPKKAV